MRILMSSFLMPSTSKIGVGHQAHALANGLVRRGHDVSVLTPSPPSEGAEYHTQTVPLFGGLATVRWPRLLQRADLRGVDVLHAHGDDFLVKHTHDAAHVRTMHGSCFDEALRIAGARERARMLWLAAGEVVSSFRADRTVAVSHATVRRMPWIKTVIPNGVPAEFSPSRDRRAGHPVVLFVGTLENRKRGRLLVEAFADVRRRFADAELRMVCEPGPAAPGVKYLGRLSEADLIDQYRQAWVFCLPSSYEGFGIPYVEALRCGTPVVATPNPGALEIAHGVDSMFIVEEGNLGHDIGELLGRMLLSSGFQERLSDQAVLQSEQYAMDSVVAEYERVYDHVLASRR